MTLMDKMEKKQIAGMVKTQWISSSLKLSPAFLVLLKKWSLKYLIDSEKTVSADIDLPLSSNNFITPPIQELRML
jgi:hypothetical protein